MARAAIREVIESHYVVVSGACHLGGIDIWAIEEAKKAGKQWQEFAPTRRTWSGPGGYQDRNMRIAQADEVVCLTVDVLPATYTGMRFKLCYHCGTDRHVKSGGCWTVKYAKTLGNLGRIIVIPNA